MLRDKVWMGCCFKVFLDFPVLSWSSFLRQILVSMFWGYILPIKRFCDQNTVRLDLTTKRFGFENVSKSCLEYKQKLLHFLDLACVVTDDTQQNKWASKGEHRVYEYNTYKQSTWIVRDRTGPEAKLLRDDVLLYFHNNSRGHY